MTATSSGSTEETLQHALGRATDLLGRAGLDSPRVEAELLAAHLLQLSPGGLRAACLRGAAAPAGLAELIAARAAGVPVQHLTGRAPFRHLELAVGEGVFIPRPETELVGQAAIDACAGLSAPLVVDLCTGSGALAAAVAHEVAGARLVAVEIDPVAGGFARRNLPEAVRLVIADATADATLADLDARVDVVVSNPPYVPDGDPISAEAGRDPAAAIFGGPTGRELPVAIARRALALLRPGGRLVLEHHDVGQGELVEALDALGFAAVLGHADLLGRPRYLTAVKPR